jgi:hypothetical protein
MNLVKVHRKISSSTLRISELKNFIGKNVEITISEARDENKIEKRAAGILAEFSNPSKISEEQDAWKIAAMNKYGNR